MARHSMHVSPFGIAPFEIEDASAAARHFSDFGHAFGEWLQHKSKDPPYRYALQEHGQEKGYCGRFFVHVPNHLKLRAENWLRGWRVEGRLAGWRDQAVECELKKHLRHRPEASNQASLGMCSLAVRRHSPGGESLGWRGQSSATFVRAPWNSKARTSPSWIN